MMKIDKKEKEPLIKPNNCQFSQSFNHDEIIQIKTDPFLYSVFPHV